MSVHGTTVGEVGTHPIHESAEAGVGGWLVVKYDQQRRDQVAHPLHVADVQVLPDIPVAGQQGRDSTQRQRYSGVM